MATILKNDPPANQEVELFVKAIDFVLPVGFIDFFRETNGAEINAEESFAVLWPLTDMIQLNKAYKVEKYAPEFFIFGSDGGDTAFAVERKTGSIFEMPFIGMSKEEATFRNQTFTGFIEDMR